MKTLTLLILLSLGIATAQEKDTTNEYTSFPNNPIVSGLGIFYFYDKWDSRTITFPKCSDTMRIIIDKDTIFTDENYLRVFVRHELSTLCDVYAKECHNDSTVKMTHHADEMNACLFDFECLISSHYWNETFHRQATFGGFIEFLRRKMK